MTDNLNAEVTRATAAEQTLTDNLNAEVTRATTAEQSLTEDLTAKVTAEVTRATTAEQSLAQDIADEELRASQEEGKISNSVIKETTRATRAESNITRHVFLVYDTYDELPTVQKDPDISVTIYTGQLAYIVGNKRYYSATVSNGAVTWHEISISNTTFMVLPVGRPADVQVGSVWIEE